MSGAKSLNGKFLMEAGDKHFITDSKIHKLDVLAILLLSLFFFLGLGHVHLFDWDEINFAESAREMLATGKYFSVQINYIPFWEKPPLFFWMQALSMKIFGVNEFAARFPNAVFGLFYLLTLYITGWKLTKNRIFAWLWVLLYFGSILPHIYFKSGIIDPVFNYFIFLSVYCMFRIYQTEGNVLQYALGAGIFSGLSFLTKGPVGLLLLLCTTAMATMLIWKKQSETSRENYLSFSCKSIKNHIFNKCFWVPAAIFLLGFLAIVSIWLGAEIYFHGFDILWRFVRYQIELFTTPVAGHGQPFYYHFVVVLIGCFPMSVFAIPMLWPFKNKPKNDYWIWMVSLFWVVMIIFSISTTKIVHYSSMTYLPLSFIAALYIREHLDRDEKMNGYLKVLYIALGSVLSLVFIGFFYLVNRPDILIPLVKDKVAKVSLAMPNIWTGYEPIIGLVFLIGFIASIVYLSKRKWVRAVISISLSTGVMLLLVSFWVLPGIERFSQGSAITFYKSLEHDDVYVETIGFKSYAQYFYKKIQPDKNPESIAREWLLEGDIDKDVYFVTKVTNTELDGRNGIQKLKCEGGFCFYLRKVVK